MRNNFQMETFISSVVPRVSRKEWIPRDAVGNGVDTEGADCLDRSGHDEPVVLDSWDGRAGTGDVEASLGCAAAAIGCLAAAEATDSVAVGATDCWAGNLDRDVPSSTFFHSSFKQSVHTKFLCLLFTKTEW